MRILAFNCIKLSHQNNVALVELSRPEALNALNTQLMKELGEAFEAISKESNIQALVVTGSQKAFAGMNICRFHHD